MPEKVNNNKGWIVALVLFNLLFIFTICGLVGVGGVYLFRNQNSNKSTSTDPITKYFDNNVTNTEGGIVDLVGKTQPAVVTVVIKGTSTSGIFQDTETEVTLGSGTGFFVSEDGLLVTNEHVVCSIEPSNINIITSDQKSYSVKSVAVDSALDIAVLKVDTENNKVPFLKFANPDTQIKVGEPVIAIGNPLGTNPGSVTKGIISGLNRNIQAQGACNSRTSIKDYEGILQTDAAINSGNSGGPLLDSAGDVIGVNAATSSDANNISYAVPSNRVIKILERYRKNNGKITSPYIGVEYSMLNADVAKTQNLPVGALVRSLVTDSPAAKAGILKSDIITKLDDKQVDFSLISTLNLNFEPGQKVKVEVYRRASLSTETQGNYTTLELTLGEK